MIPSLFDPRRRSLLRGSVFVLVSLAVAVRLSDFPNNRATLWLILPTLTSMLGTADTLRCMRGKWNLYHGGVIFLVYMDLMAVCLILFVLLYPYHHWLNSTH